MKRKIGFAGLVLLAVITGLVRPAASQQQRAGGPATQVPQFVVDTTWPKPLPNNWVFGYIAGVMVDPQDHVWVLHNPGSVSSFENGQASDPPRALCCRPAPPVIEFDQAGTVVQSWNWDPSKYDVPSVPGVPSNAEHGLYMDYQGNVWVTNGSSNSIPKSTGGQVLKFSRDGKFLLQIGKKEIGKGSNDITSMGGPTGVVVDPKTNEVFISDGYQNRRVIVFDATTGAYKRHWGAYGKPPDDTPFQFSWEPNAALPSQMRGVHCIAQSQDGLLYVCDTGSSRIHVFRTDGTFVKEIRLAPNVRAQTTNGIAFSRDPEQRYMYVADVSDGRVWILRRSDLQPLSWFGTSGHYPGGLVTPHSLAVDSKGNIYVGESTEGKRVQKFAYKGMGPAAPLP